ncbi:hypothetical protein ACFC4G_41635 [Streptomyces sp. NPDC056002]|uniref:hypothetical protein n=1 Tax=Streptomyces sp. NPDC056002 TaxID=3345675 RepID=UPI0035DC1EE8
MGEPVRFPQGEVRQPGAVHRADTDTGGARRKNEAKERCDAGEPADGWDTCRG